MPPTDVDHFDYDDNTQIPSTNAQTSTNVSITETEKLKKNFSFFVVWTLAIWDLFGIWDLVIDISVWGGFYGT